MAQQTDADQKQISGKKDIKLVYNESLHFLFKVYVVL